MAAASAVEVDTYLAIHHYRARLEAEGGSGGEP
jgi:hypothetical protein